MGVGFTQHSFRKSDGKLIENNDNDETTPRWTSVDVGSIFSSNAQVSE